jgi:hypothetical protein
MIDFKNSAFKKGQTVMVYEDPYTRAKPEGKARLLGFHGATYHPLEYWSVRFLSDGFVTDRWINPNPEDCQISREVNRERGEHV